MLCTQGGSGAQDLATEPPLALSTQHVPSRSLQNPGMSRAVPFFSSACSTFASATMFALICAWYAGVAAASLPLRTSDGLNLPSAI